MSTPELPAVLADAGALPAVLLPYQQRLVRALDAHDVVIVEKSRRVGATWAIAAAAVLTAGSARAAGGMDALYIGYNEAMTREFIDACAMWARAFLPAAGAVEERLLTDETRDIKTFRVNFASGFEVLALSSRPRNLRGKQGLVIIDEAAFHNDLAGLLKAALALLMWGGKVLVISTHNGVQNPFNALLNDACAGRAPHHVERVTFADALADGLYRRICLVRGVEWSAAGEAAWEAGIRAQYGTAAAEELDCIPADSEGTALAGWLIESRQEVIPVVRWTCDDAYQRLPSDRRRAETEDWLQSRIRPLLVACDPARQHFVGVDFGRQSDLTVIWPLCVGRDMVRRPPFVIELRRVPWEQQRQILWAILDGLPRLTGGALDAAGIGSTLAEETAQRYGMGRFARVGIDQGWRAWYRDHMPRFIAGFEDAALRVPRDAQIYEDHRALERRDGIIQAPLQRSQDDTGARHGDAAIAHALAYVSSVIGACPIEYRGGGMRAAVKPQALPYMPAPGRAGGPEMGIDRLTGSQGRNTHGLNWGGYFGG
jgi:phage FluMu gp28-like protein